MVVTNISYGDGSHMVHIETEIGQWSPPPSPFPNYTNIYSLWKVDKKFGQGPPPSFGQNPEEQLLFFGRPSLSRSLVGQDGGFYSSFNAFLFRKKHHFSLLLIICFFAAQQKSLLYNAVHVMVNCYLLRFWGQQFVVEVKIEYDNQSEK